MNTLNPHRSQRGVSLIEALVAMAVMAFGMLAVVGVQTTLRVNADLAKQRVEATRLAEQEIETLRGWVTVGSGSAAITEFDNLASAAARVIAPADSNTSYTLLRQVTDQADGLQKATMVRVSWTDRHGNPREVILRDLVTRSAPALSGLLGGAKKTTVVGQRKNRHPTIPPQALDWGNGESVFKPSEGGTVAWVFDNITGVIKSVCVVTVTTTTSTLVQSDLSGCMTTDAQLLSGHVRYNLRGISKDLGNGTSVFKPVPGDVIAWVIDNATSRIIRRCAVSAGSTTASLVASDVATCPAASLDISPFNAGDPAGYVLTAADSESPHWPALNTDVFLTLTSSGHSHAPQCFTDAPTSAVQAGSQTVVQYFCIVYPNNANGRQSWAGRSKLMPAGYSDGNGTPWSISTVVGSYRVCRYTTASTGFTDNLDHPADYSKWSSTCGLTLASPPCRPVFGNLTNQNFLVIEGTKSCPADVAANPGTGDLVNSNTLQHQP